MKIDYLFAGEVVEPGQKVFVEKHSGFGYRNKQEIINALKTDPEAYAELLIENGIIEEKEMH